MQQLRAANNQWFGKGLFGRGFGRGFGGSGGSASRFVRHVVLIEAQLTCVQDLMRVGCISAGINRGLAAANGGL